MRSVSGVVGLSLAVALFGPVASAASSRGACPGDVNGDDVVDLVDLNTVMFNFGLNCIDDVNHVIAYTLHGDSAGDLFGTSVSGIGDVNGDGSDDIIVGAFGDDNNGLTSGSARVFSGVDGSTLYTLNGDSTNDQFGSSVSGAGLVDLDGVPDVVVGAPRDSTVAVNNGMVRVYSGIDGTLIHTFLGASANRFLGGSVSGAHDVNDDGRDDLIAGEVGNNMNGNQSGAAYVFSGLDGSVLHAFYGDSLNENFGHSVGGAGDVDDDGYPDLLAGTMFDDVNGSDSGTVTVLSGWDGSVLYEFHGDSSGDGLGFSVSAVGDLNLDGFDDVIAGAHFDDNNGSASGSARVFSGADGSILYTFNGAAAGDNFGRSSSGAGDVNNDGVPDVIVGASGSDTNGASSGSALVLSGQDGSVLYTFHGDSASDMLGVSVTSAGDINGDGFADFVVGVPNDDNNGSNSGSARVFVSACPDGDLSGDGVVDLTDLNTVLFNFGLSCP